MNSLKNIGISILYILGSIFILTFITTFFHYINFFGTKIMSFWKIAIPIISMFIGGIVMGKRSHQKGWLEGVKLSGLFLIVLILFEYLGLHMTWQLKTLFFYLILVVSCVFGSMVGINFHREKE